MVRSTDCILPSGAYLDVILGEAADTTLCHKLKTMNVLYDIHTHNDCDYENVISVRNVFVSNSIPAELPTLYSASVHPWYVGRDWKKLLEENVGIIEKSAFIGECGLDKLRSHLDIDEQILLFSEMAQIAERMGKPMIIHCVKAFSELLAIHKQIKPSRVQRKAAADESAYIQGNVYQFRNKFQCRKPFLVPDRQNSVRD